MTMDPEKKADRPVEPPICSLIIPTRDKLNFLRPCITSVLNSAGSESLEIIIIDNNSEEEETLAYLKSLHDMPNIRVLPWPHIFNFSSINNFAASQCKSDVLCFLNNDIEIIDEDWLSKLLEIARMEEVGAVGCTLLYPDSTIQHAGIALDENSIAQHIGSGEKSDYLTSKSIFLPFAVDAVTAACMMIRKNLFLRLGGFNEDKLAVAFNDVDLCLRLADKGLPVLLHPGVVLTHHESVSRKSDELPSNRSRALKEHSYMQSRWHNRLEGRSYKAGTLTEMEVIARQHFESSTSIKQIIRTAADRLYLDAGATTNPAPESADDQRLALDTIAEMQDYVRNLQTDYRQLEAHAERLELGRSLIENSIFWRMTAPLRWLRNAIIPTGEKKSSPTEAVISPDNHEIVANPATEQSVDQQTQEKSRLDKQAKTAFQKFVDSSDKLSFPDEKLPRISIILVFYNQVHLSLLCLKSILQYADVPYQLIIIDNNSSDASDQLLERIENADIRRNQENLGFVRAVNQGAELATGEYLLLLNNDALLEPKTLSNALACIEEDDSIGAVGAKIKLLDGSLQEAGSIIFNDGACLGYGRGGAADKPEFMFQRDVDYCSGAFLMFRLNTFNALGGFDEDFAPAYYEESDFCIRLRQQGLRVVYSPDVEITHYEFASSGGLSGASSLQATHREILCSKHEKFLSSQFPNEPANSLLARTANNKPNVLVIDDRVPHPSLGAGYPRCSNFLNELSKLDFNLSFYPLLYPEESWDQTYTTLSRTIEVILNSGQEGLQSFLAQRSGFYQFIVVSRVHNMEFFNNVLNLHPNLTGDARIIYDAEAVSSPRDILQREIRGDVISPDIQRELIEKELNQARRATKIVAVSASEAKIFQDHGYSNTLVLGHSIESSPGPKSYRQRTGILFVGALRDEGSPNVDSLLWFLINVLPLIEDAIPDIALHVVGDNSAPSLTAIEKDNVVFTGRLDSIDEMYNSCRLFIAPTRFAAGIPHKVHEAAAMGLPSVTTSLLARQLSWKDGEELLVADDAKEFADQCIKLYQDGDLWQRLRDTGLEAVIRDCSQDAFRSALSKIFD